MTDWWLSPEVYLKRVLDRDEWRLTTLLRRKAVSAYFRFKVLKLLEVQNIWAYNTTEG